MWLNAGSSIIFPDAFDGNERRVYVEGEIYIEVARDESKPFYVETPKMDVSVLGTKFNVSAYADDATHSVVLVEGKVNVALGDDFANYDLVPNQRLSFDNSNAKIDKIEAYDFVSWKDGVFQFRGEKMGAVAQRLSRYYNMSINCSAALSDKRLSGKLMLFDDVEKVMETLSMLYDVNYKLTDGTIDIE